MSFVGILDVSEAQFCDTYRRLPAMINIHSPSGRKTSRQKILATLTQHGYRYAIRVIEGKDDIFELDVDWDIVVAFAQERSTLNEFDGEWCGFVIMNDKLRSEKIPDDTYYLVFKNLTDFTYARLMFPTLALVDAFELT